MKKLAFFIIFYMVLGVGLVSAVILAKKHPNYKTRLEKLHQKLTKKPPSRVILYEFPTKRIFSILIIIAFIYFLNYFQQDYINQSMLTYLSFKHSAIEEFNQKYQNVSVVIKWIKIGYSLMILALILDLRTKVIVVEPNVLFIKEYDRKNFGRVGKIQWKFKQSMIQIVQKGSQKFTHHTGHYIIQILDKKGKSVQHVLKRADIFHARKSMIEICSVLRVKPDLKIY